ncbi:hypothetical protein R1flu_000299 [Riccia fluitans]|uniref:Uncharacterized protein n=1 Tax=Riccia fluitans TaxID=41844 RepID=A0ABD1Y102_9MARC
MVLVMLVLEEDKGFKTLTSVMEVRNNNNNPELQMPGKLFYPSLSHLFLDEEEREIESAFPSSIRGEPSSAYAGGPQGSDARPRKSNFSNPSSVANAGTHSNNNPVFS